MAPQRLQQINSQVTGTGLATTASVAIISALGLTYMMDGYKSRQDKNLRDELKDRVQSQLEGSTAKLDQLIQNQGRLEEKMVTRSMVEDIVSTKIAEFQAKMELEEVTKKAIKLKVKPKGAQMFESSEDDRLPMKHALDEGVEMMRELREMKTVFRDSF